MKGVAAVIFLVVLAVVYLAATPGDAVSCDDVVKSLSTCLWYLTGGAGEPSQSCCDGVKSLMGSLQSQQDRQTACYCAKSAATSFRVQPHGACKLPGKCGVSVGVEVVPDVDCSKIP